MVASDLHTQKHKHAYTLTLFPTRQQNVEVRHNMDKGKKHPTK